MRNLNRVMKQQLKIVIYLILIIFFIYGCKNNSTKEAYSTPNIDAEIKDSIEIKYAKGFKIRYEKGIKLIDIQDPTDENKAIFKYALVKNKEQNNIPKGYTPIEIPIKSVICMTTLQVAGFITLEETAVVSGMTSTRFLHNQKMREQIDSGTTHRIGIEGNFDNEVIMSINPSLIFISPFKRGGYENLKDVGIPLVPHLGYKELTPLGQAEWIKFIALFLNCEKKANNIFNNIEQEYNKLKALTLNVTNRPTIFSGEVRGGGWYTVGGKSFLATLFKDAGADYFLSDNNESGGVTLDFETIYSKAANAKYWRIMNGYAGQFSYNVLAQEDNRYRDFRAFKERGIIYCNQREVGFYESSPTQPHLVLKDFIKIFHPSLIEEEYKGTYYTLLK